MQLLLDFITLRLFITPYLIVIIYWLGAFIVPLIAGLTTAWLAGKARNNDIATAGLDGFNRFVDKLPYSRPVKIGLSVFFIAIFLLLELLWRVLFEFLIALFHIHDALLNIASKT